MKLACLVRGHAWEEDSDNTESYPVLRCKRCGKRENLSGREVSSAWQATD